MSQPEHTSVNQSANANADPSKIAMRVKRIVNLVQARGHFERAFSDTQEELVTEFLPIHATAQLMNESFLSVTIVFGFAARAKQAANSAIQADANANATSAVQAAIVDNGNRIFVDAAYVILYALTPGPTPSDAELQKFAEVNGRLNATPYWREFLDTSLRRAGLPPIMAPVFKVSPEKAQDITVGSTKA